jgi:O-antigen ligase
VVFSLLDRVGLLVTSLSILAIAVAAIIGREAAGQLASALTVVRQRASRLGALWVLLFLSALVLRVRPEAAVVESPVDSWNFLRIALVGWVGASMMVNAALAKPVWPFRLLHGVPGVLVLYSALAVASTAWSAYPLLTLYKSFEFLTAVALVVAIIDREGSSQAYGNVVDLTWALYGCLLLSVWCGAIAWPERALLWEAGKAGVQLQGALPILHANTVGEVSAMLALVCVSRLLHRHGQSRRELLCLILLVCMVTLALSQTRTAWFGFLLGIGAMAAAMAPARFAAALSVVLVAGVALISLGGLAVPQILRLETGVSPEALSGRWEWWAAAWESFRASPLIGHGAYAAGRFVVLAELGQSRAASLHSTYVETLVGTGLVGVGVVVVALCWTWWVLLRAAVGRRRGSADRQPTVEAVGVLALLTVRSFFSTHLVWNHSLAFLLIVGYAELVRRESRHRPGRLCQAPHGSVSKVAATLGDGRLTEAGARRGASGGRP